MGTQSSGPSAPRAEHSSGLSASTCNYIVQQGDTLWSIAKKVYNDGSQYQKIVELNQDKNTKTLKVGEELKTCDNSNDQTNTSTSKTSDVQGGGNVSTSDVQPATAPIQPQKTFTWWNPFSWF